MANLKKLTGLIIASCISSTTFANTKIIINNLQGKDQRGQFSIDYPVLQPNQKYKKFNAELKKAVISDFICEKDKALAKRMSSDVKIHNSLISKSLLSFELNYDVYCGGAYPSIGTDYRIYNIKTTHPVIIDEQFSQLAALNAYITKEFYNQVPHDLPADCKDMVSEEALSTATIDWRILSSGFKTRVQFPHVAKACEYAIEIPCSDLKPFFKKGSAFYKFCQD